MTDSELIQEVKFLIQKYELLKGLEKIVNSFEGHEGRPGKSGGICLS